MARNLSDAVNQLDNRIKGLIQRIGNVNTSGGGGGSANTNGLATNFLSNSLGRFSTDPNRLSTRFQRYAQGAQAFGGVAGGVMEMMPQVSATMDRMTAYYGATLRTSGMSRERLQQMTLGTLQGGLTSEGSDSMVAGYLMQRGMFANASFGSTYQETLRGVRGAARYLNMDNQRAAVAIERLTAGQQSAQLLRNFGIMTANPQTGEEMTTGQIFQQLYGRLTAGRGGTPTEQQTLESFRRGALGSVLRNSGMSQDQQAMFLQYSLERSRGRNLDFSDPNAMAELERRTIAEQNENPNLPGYQLNTAGTNAMQNAQEAYLEGIKLVTPALTELKEVAGELAREFGAIKSGIATVGGDSQGRGLINAIKGLGPLGEIALPGIASFLGVKSALGKMGPGGAPSTSNSTPNTKPANALKIASKVAAPVAAATTTYEGFQQGQQGQDFSILDAGLAAGTGAAVGFGLGGPLGAGIGAAVGGIAYSGSRILGSMFGGGEGGEETTGSNTSQNNGGNKGQAFKLAHPTASAKITATFGQTHSSFDGDLVWPNGHNGLDYAGKKGDQIRAAYGGRVTLHTYGQLGKTVRIKHDNGMYTFYAHLSAFDVRDGQKVEKGDPIGKMGNTGGKSTGVHLHFALSTSSTTANCIDPMPYLQGSAKIGTETSPADQKQEASGNTPASSGRHSVANSPGGQDSSGSVNASSGSAIMGSHEYSSTAGGTGSSAASALEPWTSASVYGGTGGGQAEGGENYVGNSRRSSSTRSASMSFENGELSTDSDINKKITNNVNIQVTLSSGSGDDARRFAHMLKKTLESQDEITKMARN